MIDIGDRAKLLRDNGDGIYGMHRQIPIQNSRNPTSQLALR